MSTDKKTIILEVKNLKKIYNNHAVVNDLNLTVNQGEIFGILGPNGAGKTTTLEMIETLRPIDEGQIIVNGFDVNQDSLSVKKIIGIQPQTPAFQDKQKLKEILEMFGATYRVKVDWCQLLNDVGLLDKANSYAESLSGGQRQRFSVTVALVHNPKIFFLDEPTTGLDPQARRNLWELIKTIRDKGVTIILTTHYMDEAELLCDRVAVMDNGKIIALDKPKKLINNLIKKGFKKDQKVEQANLEDVFIDLTGKELREK
jgi:ABC-2 type transport system ATP-binding protein